MVPVVTENLNVTVFEKFAENVSPIIEETKEALPKIVEKVQATLPKIAQPIIQVENQISWTEAISQKISGNFLKK